MVRKIDPFLQCKRDEILTKAETRIKATAYEASTHFMNPGDKLNEYIFDYVRMLHSSEIKVIGKGKTKELCNDIANFILNITPPLNIS